MKEIARSRFALLAGATILSAIACFTNYYATRSTSPSPVLAGSREGGEVRARKEAEAKLRAQMEIPQGEMGVFHVSGEQMVSLLEKIPPMEPLSYPQKQGPSLHAVVSPGEVAKELAHVPMKRVPSPPPTEDRSNDFHWSNARWNVDGHPLAAKHPSRFQMTLREAQTVFLTNIDLPHGSLMLLRSAYPEPEGLVVFIGAGKAATVAQATEAK